MRILTAFIGLMLFPGMLDAVDVRPAMVREAGRYVSAWQRSDATAIVGYMPAHVVKQLGGRPALLTQLNEQFAQARALGVNELEATFARPLPPKQIGRWLAAVLAVTAVVHRPHLNLTQQTHVLAVSADQGKKWSFLLLYEISQADLITLFPEFKGKVFVPTPPDPQLKIVY